MAKYEILLLGDGSHLFRTIGWVLEYKGYQVKAAASPEAAIEALVKKNFDLVIAKLSLEDLESLEVLKKAKKLNPEVKVMVISGNHQPIFPLEAYQIDLDDYLIMPISPAELWRRVSECLEQVVDLKPTKAPAGATVTEINDRVLNRVMIMLHDIRGSMVSAAATLKLLRRGTYGELEEPAAAKVNELYFKIKRLMDLTEEFMGETLSRDLEMEIELETLDLRRDIIEPVLKELAGEMQEQGITLDNRLNSLSSGDLAVKGDKPWLKSVFRNLLTNGIKYGGRGCTIVVDLEKQGSTCRLNVYNTGRPVPEESRSMLFSRFKTGRRGRRRSNDGMGMGLYLSRDIVRNYGGDMWYEAKVDGSNFVVALPQN